MERKRGADQTRAEDKRGKEEEGKLEKRTGDGGNERERRGQ